MDLNKATFGNLLEGLDGTKNVVGVTWVEIMLVSGILGVC